MRKYLFVLVCLFSSYVVVAQIAPVIPSSVSVAGTSVSDIKSYNGFSNPANVGFISDTRFSFQYENRFSLKELSTKSISLVLPAKFSNISFATSYFGYSAYNEILIGLGFSRNFSDKFSLGLQLNYFTAYSFASDQYFGSVFPQLGLNLKLTPDLHVGFSSFNPFQSYYSSDINRARIPSIFSLGGEYYFVPELVFRIQMDKELSSNYRLSSGFEYAMLDALTLKIGAYRADYLVPCLGMKAVMSRFEIHINTELHPLLGLVSMASVQYRIKK